MTDSVISFRQRPYLSSVTTNVVPQEDTGTTWNPADKHVDISLSGGNLVATQDGSGVFRAVRSIASSASSKKYYEAVRVGNATATMGIGNASGALTDFVGGSDGNSIGYAGDGNVYINGGVGTTIQTYANGDTVCVAFDPTAELIWFRTNGGNWNNSGTANPATGTEGIDFSSLAAGPWFAMGGLNVNLHTWTVNFGATAYAQTAPSGFGNL
jgi:hypothetical protein